MGNKLVWTLTDYGLQRLTNAISDTSINLYLQKIKVGDANGNYYVPTAQQTSLKNFKESFDIKAKELDNNAVILKTTIPETSDGYDIVEVGIFEVVDTIEYLFAIGVGEPLKKPLVSDNYSIAVNYNARLTNSNLVTVYDRILLDPQSQFITTNDLMELEGDFLYTENNLAKNISTATNVVGLNKPEVLNKSIQNEIDNISRYYSFNLMANISNFTYDPSNIKALWFFNYTTTEYIKDFSDKCINIPLSKRTTLFNRSYVGFSSFINIDNENSFTLESDIDLDFVNSTGDSPLTIFTFIKPNSTTEDNVILAKSNYKPIDEDHIIGTHAFEIIKTASNEIKVNLFTDENNYISFTTSMRVIGTGASIIAISYNGNALNPSLKVFADGELRSVSKVITGSYTGMQKVKLPLTSYIVDSSGQPKNHINSQVNNICIIKEQLNDMNIKLISLNMLSQSGIDVCLS